MRRTTVPPPASTTEKTSLGARGTCGAAAYYRVIQCERRHWDKHVRRTHAFKSAGLRLGAEVQ